MIAHLLKDTVSHSLQPRKEDAANDEVSRWPSPPRAGAEPSLLLLALSKDERERLKARLAPIRYCDAGAAGYIQAVRQAAHEALPERFLAALAEQRTSLAPRPCLVFDNLPTDDEVSGAPVGAERGADHKSGSISENLAVAFAALIGEPYSISFEGRDLVNNLTPEPGKEREYTGLGSDVELDFHIENAALKFVENLNLSPTGLVLTGVRQDPGMPKTRVADARAALALLDRDDVRLLRGRHFLLRVPYRWREALGGSSLAQTAPAPLISGCELQPEAHVAFYPDMVQPLTPEATAAFQRFHRAIQQVSFGLDVTPGRLVYVDNRIALHSRDRFKARYDDAGRPLRWIQRVFVASSLWNHRSLTQLKERVFEPVVKAALETV
jgi:hypothetical protein